MNAEHTKTLREMFAECANERRMKEADALDAAIAALSAEGGAEPVARVYVTDDDYDIEWLRPYSTGFLYTRPAAAATGDGWKVGDRVEWTDNYGRVWPATIREVNPVTYDAELDNEGRGDLLGRGGLAGALLDLARGGLFAQDMPASRFASLSEDSP